MVSVIPSEGGLQAWFGGDKNVSSFGSKIADFGEHIADFSDNVKDIDGEKVKVAANAGKTLAEMTTKVPEELTDVSGFGEQIEKFGDSLVAFSETISGVDTAALKQKVSGFNDVFNEMKRIGMLGIVMFAKVFDNAGTTINNSVDKLVQGAINAVALKRPSMAIAFATMMNDVIAAIKESYSSVEEAGKDLVNGFANGIELNKYVAAEAARAMAAKAATAAKEELDENSPSRVGYEIGDFFGIAFVNAVYDNVNKARNAGKEVAYAARSGLGNAINKISSIIDSDMDIQPTIRPVIDLSNVRAGTDTLNGMFNMSPSIGVMSNLRAINRNMSSGQNGVNDDVVSAINKLGSKLGKVSGDTYQVNGITYDDGSNITEAVRTLVRHAKMERRI